MTVLFLASVALLAVCSPGLSLGCGERVSKLLYHPYDLLTMAPPSPTKALPPNTITLEIRASTNEFGRRDTTQSIVVL